MGALNAFILSMFKKGQEQKAAEVMKDIWTNLTDSQVYQNWPFWIIEGLFSRSGIYDSLPYLNTLSAIYAKYFSGFHRKLSVAMADINAGRFLQ